MVGALDEPLVGDAIERLRLESARPLHQPRDRLGLGPGLLPPERLDVDRRELKRRSECCGHRRDVRERGLAEMSAEDPLDRRFGHPASRRERGIGHAGSLTPLGQSTQELLIQGDHGEGIVSPATHDSSF